MTKRVLLTGATGFVGRACIEPLLARGYDIHALSTRQSAPMSGVTVWSGNLLNGDTIEALVRRIAPSCLLHAAWDVSTSAYWSAEVNFDWMVASARLLQAFRAAGGRRAVGVGTCAEYAWTEAVYSERESPLVPSTRYGLAKLTACRIFEVANRFGLSTAWARLFYPFGPGSQPGGLLPSVITSLFAQRPADCTAGTQIRDYVYVEDVGGALAALLDSDVAGPVNIGSGAGIAVRDLVMMVATSLGRPDLVRLGALPIREGDPPSIVADISRLHREVGFVPVTGLSEGIQRTIAFWADKNSAPASGIPA